MLEQRDFWRANVFFFFLLLVGIGIGTRASLLAAAMVGLGTPIFAYSGWLFSEPLTAAIFVGVALLLFGRGPLRLPGRLPPLRDCFWTSRLGTANQRTRNSRVRRGDSGARRQAGLARRVWAVRGIGRRRRGPARP